MFVLGVFLFALAGNVWPAPVLYNGHYYEIDRQHRNLEFVRKWGRIKRRPPRNHQRCGWAVVAARQFTASNLWIGFTDQASEGTWEWISGEAVTYTNWASGEPKDANGEDYAVMNW